MASGTLSSAGIARHTIWAARLVVLAVFLDLFVQFPTIAPFAEGLGASAALVGIIVAAYSVTNLFGNLGAGFVLDRWGRRLPIVVGLAITIVAVFSYSLVQTSEQLIAVRAMHGIGAAVLAPGAFSMIGDRAPSDRWGRAMGLTGALIAVAALVGPPAAGILRDTWGADAVFFVDSAVLLMTLITFLVIARDDDPGAHARTGGSASGVTGKKPREIPPSGRRMAPHSPSPSALGRLSRTCPWCWKTRERPAARTGYSFGIYAFVAMLVMASPLNRASDRFGRFGPLIVGLVGVAAGLVMLGMFTGYAGISLGMAVFGLGYGIVFPAAAALVIGAAGADRRGMAFGIFYAVYSLGVVVGAAGSGILADLDDGFVGLPFLAAAAVCTCCRASCGIHEALCG